MYIEKLTPVDIKLDGRIAITDETKPTSTQTTSPTNVALNNTISPTNSPSNTDTGAGVMVPSKWSLVAAIVVGAIMWVL